MIRPDTGETWLDPGSLPNSLGDLGKDLASGCPSAQQWVGQVVAKGLLLPSLWLGSQGPRSRGSQTQRPQQATAWVVAPHKHQQQQEDPRWQVKGAGILGHSDAGSLLSASQRGLQPRQVAGDVQIRVTLGMVTGSPQGQREQPRPPEPRPCPAWAVLTRQLRPEALGGVPQSAPHQGP